MIITNTLSLRQRFKVSYWKRQSDSNNTIVFVHGFGSSKEHFRYAFNSPLFKNFTIVASDLIGFGQSSGPEDFDYSIKEQASIILELLDILGTETFHLCGHSMGGLVAMKMVELEPKRVLSFINLEGNLTIDDCTFSGRVVESTLEEFASEGRSKLEKEFSDAGRDDPSMGEYTETFCMASTAALYKSAYHTVEDSSTPLIEKFLRIKNACYVYGEKNRGMFPSEKLLRASEVPIFYIERSGHSMAIENPHQLYGVMRTFIDRISPNNFP
jgi:pimeloyl-ACP methyl ester carboxylesterase